MTHAPARDKVIGLSLAVLAVPSGFAVLSIAGNLAGFVSVEPGLVWLVVFSFRADCAGEYSVAVLSPHHAS